MLRTSSPVLRGFKDKGGIMVPAASVPTQVSSFVVEYGPKQSIVVTSDTKRTNRSGYVVFEVGPIFQTPIVHATRIVEDSEKQQHPYSTATKRRKIIAASTRPSIRFVAPQALPCVVQYFDGGINRYMVFPRDFDPTEYTPGTTVVHRAPMERWSLENPLKRTMSAAAPSVPLQCLLSSTHDATECTSTDPWISRCFDAFFDARANNNAAIAAESLSSPAFVMLAIYIFAATLFSAAWNSLPECRQHPVPLSVVQSFVEAKEATCLCIINTFVAFLLSPFKRYLQESDVDIEPLIPFFVGGRARYQHCTSVPVEFQYIMDIPDKLFVFEDVFSLPPAEFVASGKYYIKAGRLYAWNSQLKDWLIRELGNDVTAYYANASPTIRRAAGKIMHLVTNVFAMDTTRTRYTRVVRDPVYRHWLLESNPFSARMHDAFLVGMNTENPTSATSLVIRMKTGMEYALRQCGVAQGWRCGKVDCKRTDDGRTRVSFSICGMKQCIAEGCHPHQSDSHMFCTAFTDLECHPTTMFIQSRASGNHPSAKNGKFGIIAIVTVPVDTLTEKIDFKRLKPSNSRQSII